MKLLILFCISFANASNKIDIFLPEEIRELRDIEQESTFCTSIALDPKPDNKPIYITKIVPRLSEDTNHLSLVSINDDNKIEREGLHECSTLRANISNSWQSGGNSDLEVQTLFITGQNTRQKSLKLPKGVAFEIRPQTRLILQVHFAPYKNYRKAMDKIGVTLFYTGIKQPLKAGILSLHAGGQVKSGWSDLKASCIMEQNLWPLAILGHTHDLGRQVSGWKQKFKNSTWTQIGQVDPKQPQVFKSLTSFNILTRKEIIEVRCSYKNPDSNSVLTGPDRREEMCALYLLYCTPDDVLKNSYCIGGNVEND